MMKDEKGLIAQAFAFEKNSQTEAFSVVPVMGGIHPVSRPISLRSIG
jgi:hypothetical protein